MRHRKNLRAIDLKFGLVKFPVLRVSHRCGVASCVLDSADCTRAGPCAKLFLPSYCRARRPTSARRPARLANQNRQGDQYSWQVGYLHAPGARPLGGLIQSNQAPNGDRKKTRPPNGAASIVNGLGRTHCFLSILESVFTSAPVLKRSGAYPDAPVGSFGSEFQALQ